jgi:large subunit ribosomal protein L23
MKHLSNFIIRPIVSEKSYKEAKNTNKYTFVVAKSANKTDVKNAIEKLFGVDVKHVYTANIKGMKVRNTRLGRQEIDESYKKARVLLASGQSIAIFEESTDEAKKEDKSRKAGSRSAGKNEKEKKK